MGVAPAGAPLAYRAVGAAHLLRDGRMGPERMLGGGQHDLGAHDPRISRRCLPRQVLETATLLRRETDPTDGLRSSGHWSIPPW